MKKKIIIAGLTFILGLSLFIVLLPQIASTPWGNQKVLEMIHTYSGKSLKAESMQFSWFGPQIARGVLITDKEQNEIAVSHLIVHSPLIKWIGKKDIQNVAFENLQMVLKEPKTQSILELYEVFGEVKSASKDTPFICKIKGRTREGDLIGSFEINLQLEDWNIGHLLSDEFKSKNLMPKDGSKALLDVEIKNFPVDLFDVYLSHDHPKLQGILREALGYKFDLSLKQVMGKDGVDLNLLASSPNAEARFLINYSENLVSLKSPSTFKWTITPSFINQLSSKHRLLHPATLEVNFDALSLPMETSTENMPSILLDRINFVGQVNISDFNLSEAAHVGALALQELSTTWNFDARQNHLALDFNGSVRDESVAGGINGTMSLKNLLKSHEIDLTSIEMNVSTSFTHFPLKFLCKAFFTNASIGNQIQILLGNYFDGEIKVNMTNMIGSLFTNIQGEHSKIFLDGHVNKNKLSLNKEFTLESRANQTLGRYVLGEYVSLFKGMLNSEGTIRLTIDPKSFSMTFAPFHLANLQISSGRLDLNKLQFSRDSEFGKILQILPGSLPNVFSVWYTPLYFSTHGGIIKLERMDMLISNEYPIAAWGTVDLVKDRLDMTVGLLALALEKSLNIAIPDKNYVLQLPLRGPLKNPSLDKAKAAAKISSLVARKQGPQGILISTLLDIAGGASTEDKIPPPTTDPLPWSISSAPSNGQPQEKLDVNEALQQLEKRAGGLIKKIFK